MSGWSKDPKQQKQLADLFEATVRIYRNPPAGSDALLLHDLVVAAQRMLVCYGGDRQSGNAAYLSGVAQELRAQTDARVLAEELKVRQDAVRAYRAAGGKL